jgi:uncharacterized membrane protein
MNFDHRQLPFGGQGRQFFPGGGGDRHFGHGEHPLGWVIFALLLAVLAVLLVNLVLKLLASRRAAASTQPVAPGAEPLALLRLRYARGEVGRDEFLRASEDLGAAPGEAEAS